MDERKLTPWFPPEVLPVRIGEYNASTSHNAALRRWWDGKVWSECYRSWDPKDFKEARKQLATDCGSIYWRGLAQDPEEGGDHA